MYFPRFLDEDAVEDSGVTISATLDTTALYSKCSLYVENLLEVNAHSLYLHYSQVVPAFVASGS